MSSKGTGAFSVGHGKCYAFIDADNVELGFRDAFKHRELVEAGEKYYSLELLLRSVPATRKYLFSAAAEGQDAHNWLIKLRAEQSFVYRQGKLVEKGKTRKQQGVDVMMAVEALKCAHSKIIESCIIFSDDGDLLPLVSAIVDLGVHTSVFGFGNPAKSPVARDFQDACDNYVHIGDHILANTVISDGRASKSGNCTKSMFEEFGAVESFDDGANSHAIVRDKDGGLYICNDPLERMNDYNQSYYYYFANEAAAMARYKLLGSFFQ